MSHFKVILPAEASRSEWLAARRKGIGASDIPAVMGVVPQRPAIAVYHDKLGELHGDDAGEAAMWGLLDEETTARYWAQVNHSAIAPIGLIARVDEPWMMCTLDRRVTECPLDPERREICALEVKHRSAWLAGAWRRDVPDDVLAQVLWQMAVTGYDHIHVACRIGGNEFRQRVVRRKGNEQLIEDIITVARRLWFDHILMRTPPPYTGNEDPDSLLDMYGQLHPEREGLVDLSLDSAVSVAVMDDLRIYEEERNEAAKHKKEMAAAKARLVKRLGGSEEAFLGNQFAYSFKEQAGARLVNLDRLAERHPDAYADCVSETTHRRLTIDRSFRITEVNQ